MGQKTSALAMVLVLSFSNAVQSAEFQVDSLQYRQLLDMMQEKGIMPDYHSNCKQEKTDSYVCEIRGDQVFIITYAQTETGKLTAITLVATSKSVDRVSALAAMASLSLDKKFMSMKNQTKGLAMVKNEKDAIARAMSEVVLHGGDDTGMELTNGGERFIYELGPGRAAVKIVPRDWK